MARVFVTGSSTGLDPDGRTVIAGARPSRRGPWAQSGERGWRACVTAGHTMLLPTMLTDAVRDWLSQRGWQLRSDLLGQEMQLLECEAVRHSGPMDRSHKMVYAKLPAELTQLIRDLRR